MSAAAYSGGIGLMVIMLYYHDLDNYIPCNISKKAKSQKNFFFLLSVLLGWAHGKRRYQAQNKRGVFWPESKRGRFY